MQVSREKYSLILVGTGFASAFFLKKYLEKNGSSVSVLVLERGKYIPHSTRLQRTQSKRLGEIKPTSYDGSVHDLYQNSDPGKPWIFDTNFGGSSNCWTGCTPRFLPNDFRLKSAYGVGSDWPITYDELEPYYCEAEKIMAISGPQGTPYPMSQAYPLPPHKLGTVDKLLNEHYDNLYISQPTARASIPVGNRNSCCTSSVCSVCPVNSKFTVENSLKHVFDHNENVQVEYQAQVHSLVLQGETVKRVIYRIDGRDREAEGDVVALGANALFNAHILLNSGDDNELVGKNISEQRSIHATLYLKDFDNLGGTSIISANGYMLYDGEHRKEHAACLIEHANWPLVRSEFGKWRHVARFRFIFEDIPRKENKVVKTDNVIKPRIEWNGHHEYLNRALDNLHKKIDKIFAPLPIENIMIDRKWQKTECHICSTTMMGDNGENSVLDKNLIHHRYRNLFVLGSGSFPTITPSNPTLTLSALSLMSADRSF